MNKKIFVFGLLVSLVFGTHATAFTAIGPKIDDAGFDRGMTVELVGTSASHSPDS